MLESLEYLKEVSLNDDNKREQKLKHIHNIDTELPTPLWRSTTDFPVHLGSAIYVMLRMLADQDMNVWSLAKEVLNKQVKSMLKFHHDIILEQLFRGMRGHKVSGRSQRVSLELFAAVCHHIKPYHCHKYLSPLLSVVRGILDKYDDILLLETLGANFDQISSHFMRYISDSDARTLIDKFTKNLRLEQGAIRRAAASGILATIRHYPQPVALIRYTADAIKNLQDKIDSSKENEFKMNRLRSASTPIPVASSTTTTTTTTSSAATAENVPTNSQILPADEEASISFARQGQLHCFLQVFKLSTEIHLREKYSVNPMLCDLIFCVKLCRETLKSNDNNVVVAALELLQELLGSYWHYLSEIWEIAEKNSSTTNAREIMSQFQGLLLGESTRISAKSLIVACCCKLLSAHQLGWKLFPAKFTSQVLSLMDHSDPALRGQASLFVGGLISSYCSRIPFFKRNMEFQKKEKDSSDDEYGLNINVGELVLCLLEKSMQENNSIAAKLSCQGVVQCWNSLANSEYALYALYVIKRLLQIDLNAYRLVKTEVLIFFGGVDYNLVNFLEKCGHEGFGVGEVSPFVPCDGLQLSHQRLQSDCIYKVLSFLTDTDNHVRTIAAESLASMLSKLHYVGYWQKDVQWSSGQMATRFDHDLPDTVKEHQSLMISSDLSSHLWDWGGNSSDQEIFPVATTKGYRHQSEQRHSSTSSSTTSTAFSSMSQVADSPKSEIGRNFSIDFEQFYHIQQSTQARFHWFLNELVEGLNKNQESTLLKGIYRTFRQMAVHEYQLPVNLILPVILDQMEATPACIDLETQYDLLVLLGHTVGHLTRDLTRYAQRIFLHFLRILYVVNAIIRKQQRPPFKEPKPGVIDNTLEAIQGHPQYLKLWERLSETYRLGRATFAESNMFENIQCVAFQGLTQCIATLNRQYINSYSTEILGYIAVSFDDQTLVTVECLRMLFVSVFSPSRESSLGKSVFPEASNAATLYATLMPSPQLPSHSSGAHRNRPTPLGSTPPPSMTAVSNSSDATTSDSQDSEQSSLLVQPGEHPLFSPLLRDSQKSDSYDNGNSSWLSTHGSGWIQVVCDLSAKATPQEMTVVLQSPIKRQLLRQFEPLVVAATHKYLATQKPHVQQSILLLLTTLIKLEVEFSLLDKDHSFFNTVAKEIQPNSTSPLVSAQLYFMSSLHIEKRYLRNVLNSQKFSELMTSAFRSWNTLQSPFIPSMMALLYSVFTTHDLSEKNSHKFDDTEEKMIERTREDVLRNLLTKIPHPIAVQMVLFVVDLLEVEDVRQRATSAPTTPDLESSSDHESEISNTEPPQLSSTVGKFYQQIISEINIMIQTERWRLSEITMHDLYGICKLVDRLPKKELDILDIISNIDSLLFEPKENIPSTSNNNDNNNNNNNNDNNNENEKQESSNDKKEKTEEERNVSDSLPPSSQLHALYDLSISSSKNTHIITANAMKFLWLPSIIISIRLLYQFDRNEIANGIEKFLKSRSSDNSEKSSTNDPIEYVQNWISRFLLLASEQRVRWSEISSRMISSLIDSITFGLSHKFPAKVGDKFLIELFSSPRSSSLLETLSSLTCSYQTSCGFSIVRLFLYWTQNKTTRISDNNNDNNSNDNDNNNDNNDKSNNCNMLGSHSASISLLLSPSLLSPTKIPTTTSLVATTEISPSTTTTWHNFALRSTSFLAAVRTWKSTITPAKTGNEIFPDLEFSRVLESHCLEKISGIKKLEESKTISNSDLISNDLIRLLLQHITDPDVREFCFRLSAHNVHFQKFITTFVAYRMEFPYVPFSEGSSEFRHVRLSAYHRLLLFLTCAAPGKEVLEILFSKFMKFPAMSVRIAVENYLLNLLLSKPQISNFEEILTFVKNHRTDLRDSFTKKLTKFHLLDEEVKSPLELPPLTDIKISDTNYAEKWNSISTSWIVSYVSQSINPRKLLSHSLNTLSTPSGSNIEIIMRLIGSEELSEKTNKTTFNHVQSYHVLSQLTNESFATNSPPSKDGLQYKLLNFISKKISVRPILSSHTNDHVPSDNEELMVLHCFESLPLLTKVLTLTKGAVWTEPWSHFSFPSRPDLLSISVHLIRHVMCHLRDKSGWISPYHVYLVIEFLLCLLRLSPSYSATSNHYDPFWNGIIIVLYNLYFLLFNPPSTQIPVSISSGNSATINGQLVNPVTINHVTPLLSYFWHILRTCRLEHAPIFIHVVPGGGTFWRLQDDKVRYYHLHDFFLCSFWEIGRIIGKEHDIYPFQAAIINLDNNDDPAGILGSFVRLIHGKPNDTDVAIFDHTWQQLSAIINVGDENRHEDFATSPSLKRVALQAIVALIIKSASPLQQHELLQQPRKLSRAIPRKLSREKPQEPDQQHEEFPHQPPPQPPQQPPPQPPPHLPPPQPPQQSPPQSQKDLSSLRSVVQEKLSELLKIISHHISVYIKQQKFSELILQHECFKSLVLLIPLMSQQWLEWTAVQLHVISASFPEFGDDPIVHECVLVGIAKAECYLLEFRKAPSSAPVDLPLPFFSPPGVSSSVASNTQVRIEKILSLLSSCFGDEQTEFHITALQSALTLLEARHPLAGILYVPSIISWVTQQEKEAASLGEISQSPTQLLSKNPHSQLWLEKLQQTAKLLSAIKPSPATSTASATPSTSATAPTSPPSTLFGKNSPFSPTPSTVSSVTKPSLGSVNQLASTVSSASTFKALSKSRTSKKTLRWPKIRSDWHTDQKRKSYEDPSENSGVDIPMTPRRQPQSPNPEMDPDVLLKSLEIVKNLTEKIKKKDRIASKELAKTLMSRFSAQQSLGLLFSELSKPTDNTHRITEVLACMVSPDVFFTTSVSSGISSAPPSDVNITDIDYSGDYVVTRSILAQWIVMTLDNFVQLVSLNRDVQAMITLTCLFLTGGTLPIRFVILKNILSDCLPTGDQALQNIFLFSGCDFFISISDDKNTQLSFLKTMGKIKRSPFTELTDKCSKLLL